MTLMYLAGVCMGAIVGILFSGFIFGLHVPEKYQIKKDYSKILLLLFVASAILAAFAN